MAYKALYRTFRPQKFADVIGQEHITRTLQNQIQSGRIAHAYLFSGGRGSGKTSTAKILSRAVNCLNPQNGEPCNECEICKAALEGSLTDISEIDAASNNGVDNIRDIREEVEYVPTNAKYRVYIIDEVHMLSTGAFNALLKTLEEPPKHVIFVLATTEPQKLPNTILSRCQRFDFRRISIENIVKRLTYICHEVGVEAEERALLLIAKMADGAMRDAISLLDRVIAEGDTKITEDKIRALVGVPEFEYLYQIIKDLIDSDAEGILNHAEKIIEEGKDLEYYTWELIKFVRDLVVFKVTSACELYGEEEKTKMKDLLEITDKTKLLHFIASLSELQNRMKWAMDKEIIFETGLLNIVTAETTMSIARNDSKPNKNAMNVPVNTATHNGNVSNERVEPIIENTSNVGNSDLKNKVLTNLKENRKMIMHTILSNASFQMVEDDLVHIVFSKNIEDVNKQYMQKEDSKVLIKEVMKNVLQKDIRIKYVF